MIASFIPYRSMLSEPARSTRYSLPMRMASSPSGCSSWICGAEVATLSIAIITVTKLISDKHLQQPSRLKRRKGLQSPAP